MKVAVWRYSLSLQTELDDKVGGGRITHGIVSALLRLGHEVTLCGGVSPSSGLQLVAEGCRLQKDLLNLKGFDAAFVMTGPRNMLYGAKSIPETYERLASLPKGAPAAYFMWDCGLPFMFRPERDAGFAKLSGRGWADVKHLDWSLVYQGLETSCRQRGGDSVAYASTPYRYVRAFLELGEVMGDPLPPATEYDNALGYFGSDRPGRLAEVKRFLAPFHSHVYGKWTEASRAKVASPSLEFREPVPEHEVYARLNRYLATVFITDKAYAVADYLTKRAFECALAGVPVLYSDRIPASLANLGVPIVRSSGDVALHVQLMLKDPAYRKKLALDNQQRLLGFARSRPNTVEWGVRQVLRQAS